MRTIKFRGKEIHTGNWVFGGIIPTRSGAWITVSKNENTYDSYRVTPNSIGIFTGATDSKGTEIYDGDILRGIKQFADGSYPEALVMFDLHSGINIRTSKHRNFAKFSVLLNRDGVAINVEVIGNIHDNPELLEGGERCYFLE